MIRAVPLALPEAMVFDAEVHRDARGSFREMWRDDAYAAAGASGPFVCDGVSISAKNVLRGLHFQHPRGQGKLVTVVYGSVFDVVVDVRRGSPTFGQWAGIELSEANGRQLWIPPTFAHGFVALSESAVLAYKCTDYYAPEAEHAIRWDDPVLAIRWPVSAPTVSVRDAAASRLAEILPDHLPPFVNAGA